MHLGTLINVQGLTKSINIQYILCYIILIIFPWKPCEWEGVFIPGHPVDMLVELFYK